MMRQVLSIQSSVAAGFVGNTVSGPVLTVLGQHPILVDTVMLAAHPGYGKRAGGAVPDNILAAVLDGILTLTDTSDINIVTSGYLGSAAQVAGIAAFVDGWRDATGGTYILDPVLGEGGRLYVAQEIADAMIAELLPRADIITPNHYELSCLAGRDVGGPDDSARAASELIDRYGLKAVVTTGVAGDDRTGDLLVTADSGTSWQGAGDAGKNVAGGGDLLTALLAGMLNLGWELPDAFKAASHTARSIIAASPDGRDLALLQSLEIVRALAR